MAMRPNAKVGDACVRLLDALYSDLDKTDS